jgi:hypothetical protein
MARSNDAWQKSADAVTAAQNEHLEACQKYGENSPEAFVADEKAFAEYFRHVKAHGNSSDRYRG